MKRGLLKLYDQYISGTAEKALVSLQIFLLCHMSREAARILGVNDKKVYITTRVLKHLYDKKPAEEFTFLLAHLYTITKYPDCIYRNKNSKRGNYCLTKVLEACVYFCAVETKEDAVYIVTAFRIRDLDYLKDYKLLWSWRGGEPHRNAFGTGQDRATNIPQ